jgi:hypothetical protein
VARARSGIEQDHAYSLLGLYDVPKLGIALCKVHALQERERKEREREEGERERGRKERERERKEREGERERAPARRDPLRGARQVRNPWGRGEWTGRFSAQSDAWRDVPQARPSRRYPAALASQPVREAAPKVVETAPKAVPFREPCGKHLLARG